MTVYAVVDRATLNVLGEFDVPEDAERLYAELVDADEAAANALDIVAADDETPPATSAVPFGVRDATAA